MYLIIPRISLTWEGVSIKKWFRQTLSLKFSSVPTGRTDLSLLWGGLKQNGFMITVYKSPGHSLTGKTSNSASSHTPYLCPYCRKQFTEPYSFLPSYHRRTSRLAFYCLLLRQTFSLKQIQRLTGVSVQTVCRLLDTICYPPPDQLPQALSIDEFKGNASTGKYQCILVDPKKRRILDILPIRSKPSG